jgi:serine/threonine protein kinase
MGKSLFTSSSDIFSLGCLTYNLITGGGRKTIFLGNTAEETLKNNETLDT